MPTSSSPLIMSLRSGKNSNESQKLKLKSKLNQSKSNASVLKVGAHNQDKPKGNSNDELVDIKSLIDEQNRMHESSIRALREEFNAKCVKYESIVESFKCDINDLRKKQGEMVGLLYTLNATSLNFSLPIGFNRQIDTPTLNNSVIENSELNKRIQSLESNFEHHRTLVHTNIAQIEENISANSESIVELIHHLNESSQQSMSTFDPSNIQVNAIQCIQTEIDKVNIATMQNEERFIRLNTQLHVLSAKFIDFNAKMIDFIRNLNRKTSLKTQVQNDQFIDSDTVPFMQADVLTGETFGNQFASAQTANNRFGDKYNRFAFSKFVRVCIDKARILNLDSFINEFEKCFTSIIGEKAFNQSYIEKYFITQGLVDRVIVVICFNVPMSYSFLNSFAFPVNWHFVECMNRNTHTHGKYRYSKNIVGPSTDGWRKRNQHHRSAVYVQRVKPSVHQNVTSNR